MKSVLVIGASGDQGAAQLLALHKAGYKAAAASRRPGSARLGEGAQAVYLDLLIPESLPPALASVDAVFLNLPSASFNDPSRIMEGFDNFLRAATQSGLSRVVFNASLFVGDHPTGYPAHDTRFHIVQKLLASTVAATVVCPVIFLDNILRGWALPELRRRRVLRYPHGEDLPVSWITLHDVARIMIALLESSDSVARKYVVGGPQALRGPETARELSLAWGESIRFESQPIERFAAEMGDLFSGGEHSDKARIANDLRRIYTWYNAASPSPLTVDMRSFLERHPLSLTSVREWAAQNPLATSG